jgi:hypothetical protein
MGLVRDADLIVIAGARMRLGTTGAKIWTALRYAALVVGLVTSATGPTRAQVVDPNLWVTDGTVYATVLDGNTLYIGGDFTYVGPNTGSWAPVDALTGVPRAGWPIVDGTVYAVASDGAGGWYIGGDFTHVGGVVRSRLAHVRADATLDAWNPSANAFVFCLLMSNGVVYAGGAFSSIGGQSRNGIAALDPSTGLATPWNPNAIGFAVNALAVSNGVVYTGGSFSGIGGQPRNNIAALDATSGLATTWNPDADNTVRAVVVSNGLVYSGGEFASIGGQLRSKIAAVDMSSGLATSWNPNADDVVRTLAVSSSVIYAGGDFSNIGGQSRKGLAALSAASGQATAWNPNAAGPNGFGVITLAITNSVVYAGGEFTSIGGQTRKRIAALDAGSVLATAWNPDANGLAVIALAVSNSVVYAGGDFSSIGGQSRNRIAALDVTSGQVTAWNPNASDDVGGLAVSGGVVYAGGSFTSIGGQSRNHIAALDSASGQATAWNANSFVRTLAVSDGVVYAGGGFTSIGGQSRNYIAALDTASGLATAWNPNASSVVSALAVSNGLVYAGGDFGIIGGQLRIKIAALDATSGLAVAWNPNADGQVDDLSVSSGVVYVGGAFTSIGGQSRSCVAALDMTSGLATAWNPNAYGSPYGDVYALAASNSAVYAGGLFTSIGGHSRNYVAALDATSGLATTWSADADYYVFDLAAGGDAVYVGGAFTSIGGGEQSFLARIYPTPTSRPSVTVVSPGGGENVNIGTVRQLTWDAIAPYPGVQSVDVYLSRDGMAGPWELLAAAAPNTGHYNWTVTGPASNGSCYLWVTARDWTGATGSDINDAGFTIGSGLLSAGPGAGVTAFALSTPAPDPIRVRGTLSYALPHATRLRLGLYDVQGRAVSVLASGTRESGRYTATLDASDLKPGIYFVRLQAPGTNLTRRLVVAE